MKKFLALIFCLSALTGNAQVQENSWINYSQSYFKFPVYRDGIHRITYSNLLNAGINVAAINPKKIQIIGRGEEQYLFVQGESDGVFNTSDYIDFYATHNDGSYDSTLFGNPGDRANPDYSMFTDTIFYYLTWDDNSDGKRYQIESDVNFSSYSPLPYYWNEIKLIQKDQFSGGQLTVFNWPVPEYSSGEGWGSSTFSHGGYKELKPQTKHAVLSAPSSTIKAGIAGRTSNIHVVQPVVEGQEYDKITFNGYEMNHIEFDFPSSLLKDPTQVLFSSLPESGNVKERLALMYFRIRYPSEYRLQNKEELLMGIPSGAGVKDYLQMTDFDNLNSTVWLYDLTNHKKITVQASGGTYKALVPNLGKERKCFLTSEAKIKSVSELKPVSGQSPIFIDYESLSTQKGGADYFIVSANHLLTSANEYASYRDLKGFKSIVLDIEQLYDQYAYGVRKHPMSIRNLMLKALNEWPSPPAYLLLLGKSVSADFSRSSTYFELNSVPTWGVLGADVGFTNGIFGTTILQPAIPTGRIAALTDEEVRIYLNKIQDYESADKAQWMKNVLHFGGGQSATEQLTFKNYLNQFEDIIESPSFGGKVHTFLKSSSDPLQINLSDSVTNLINEGVTLMTFFGHAYGSNFDQSIDEPENYSNTGRYGFVLANSCLIGNIHTTNTQSGSERFVLAEDKGTIGFLGSSSLGVPSYLYTYSKSFYTQLANNSYGKPIGEVVLQTIRNIQDSTNVFNRDVCMHMTLHGDPAVVLNAHEKPDYSLYGKAGLTQPQVYFTPAEVTNEVDSFDINIVVSNLGKAKTEGFNVTIRRSTPSSPDSTFEVSMTDVYYKDTLVLTLPVSIANSVGLNSFEIEIDALQLLDESTRINNVATASLLIQSSEIIPVYPYEFAVVPDQYPVLKASTGNPYAEFTSYVFEIDTNENFSSAAKLQETVQSSGGLVEWNPNISVSLKSFFNQFASSTALGSPTIYFWRVRPVLASGKELWKGSSFQYVTAKEGWGQAHFQQLKKNDFQFIDYDYAAGNQEFIEQVKKINASCHLNPNLREHTFYQIDGAIVCQNSSQWAQMIFVAVIDKVTLLPWHVKSQGDFGHANFNDKIIETWNQENFYFYSNGATGLDSLMSFIDHVPDSNYILMYNFIAHNLPFWYSKTNGTGADLRNLMQTMGADVDSMASYENNEPYIFFTQKGDPSKTKESFAVGGEQLITLKAEVKNNWLDGTMTSTLVGPAQSWGSFHWEVKEGEPGNLLDSNRIRMYGVDLNGSRVKLLDTLSSKGDVLDLSWIDASVYPSLELSLYLSDDSLRTPKELSRWQVVYEELPELALNPNRSASINLKDSVQEGESYVFTTVIENIGKYNMDSVQVVYWLVDNDFTIKNTTYKMLAPLAVGEYYLDSVVFETEGLEGTNSVWYEINPLEGERAWQPEQHHFNNIHLSQFYVQKDEINPLLDVTFDGIHILNGDIVSPKPYIVVTLDDENQYLELNDPSLIQLFLAYPNTGTDSLILLDPSSYVFTPAELPKNKATIEFQGDFPQDGIYELRVMSRDRSSNISGKGDGVFDYSISFEVIHQSSITQVLNWPNPFSTSTQFVFTLTGSEIPEHFLLQIMTITGKIVREVDKEEFGDIHIGRNISDFKWDGKDQYGDQLANGVYLYRVQVKTEGHEFEERSVNVSNQDGTATLKDKFFTKGFGKMYLLR